MNIAETIKAAYEKDQRRAGQKVRRIDELPLAYEDLTEEWLTAALCNATPGARVVGFRLGPIDTGSANRRKIAVEYNDTGRAAGLPTKVFCKASQDLANRIVLGVSGGSYVETTFYARLRPLLDIEAPRPYYSRFDPDTFNSLVILGDISDEVTEFCTDKTHMDRARAESEMRLLATLHGTCYSNARAKTELAHIPTWPEFFHRTLAFGMQEGSNQGFLAAKEVIPPATYRRFDEIWPKTLASVELHNHLPHTLAHGDVHLKNWYVAGNGEMGLSDWQCAGRGHWGRDDAYAIATALTIDNRRAWEKDLLRYYLDHLSAAGGPTVKFEDAWIHYRQQLMTALTWWTITLRPTKDLPDMQPRDTTLAFIGRISQAMEDVGTLDAFA
jgi:Phosphotransferase enzyme family